MARIGEVTFEPRRADEGKGRPVISRREFLARVAMLGLLCSTGNLVLDRPSRAMIQTPSGEIAVQQSPLTIAKVGKWFRDGSLTSEALTKTYLECIRQFNSQLNAFITIMEEQALAVAAERDAELRAGIDRGPLHGIPIVHKDIYDTVGVPTTIGSEVFKGRVPEEDATVVERLSEAGVIVLGKTNMNEFAAGVSGTNEFYGDAHNPWALSRSPGGSSSGTGAAIAAGLCLGGTGTDTGGSVRVPASWCGITGIRPTYGLVSLAGVYPRAYSLDTAGPLARSVADVAMLLDYMAGYDPKDPNSSPNRIVGSYTDNLQEGVRGLRLGIVEDYTFRDVDSEVASAVQSAADTFAMLGAEIETIEAPVLSELNYPELFNNVLLYEFNQILGEEYDATEDKKVFGSTVRDNIEKGSQISRETYEDALRERPAQIQQGQEQVFTKVDALLTPTLPMVAPSLSAGSDTYDRGRQFTLPFSFLEWPCISVPSGFGSEGLPIGLLIIGNRFQEALILRIAAAFEAATDFHKQFPPIYCNLEDHLPSTGGPALPSTGGPVDELWSSLLKAIESIFEL
jgi:aspartyl-tRNA(Asn)/glutamyl-tRNA(Gln) amidotransferase subunit A